MVKSISVVSIMLGMLVGSLIADTTYVSGIINTNTVWSPSGSPYIITGNVLVNTGVQLEIQPGVKILFNYDKYLMIKGKLKAIGTEQDSIIFTALDTAQRWRRLWFKPEAFGCSLKYCRISYANNSAIYNEDTLYIGYCTITNNYAIYGGGIYNCFGTITIDNNTITDNGAISNDTFAGCYYGGGIYNYGSATITNNTITNNSAFYGGGICNDAECRSAIMNNAITNNSTEYTGDIRNWYMATITNNIIINNNANYGGSIYNDGVATIMNNTIIDSTASTIRIDYGSISLNYNNLNNLRPTGYTVYNNTTDTINARNNYWFTVDTLVIMQKIYDFWDDFTKGIVYYRPFLTAPIGVKEQLSLDAKRTMLKIYPNPARAYFTVHLPKILNQVQNDIVLEIYDVTGKLIKVQEFKSSKVQRISTDGIKSGVYFVKVNDAMIKEKLVVTK